MFHRKLKLITADVNCILQTINVNSLEHLSEVLYCVAKVVTGECGIFFHAATTGSHTPQPAWKIRLQNKIGYLRRDYSQLLALKNNRLLCQVKMSRLMSMYNLQSQPIDTVCEQLLQKIKAFSLRLRCYITRQLKRLQNKLFHNNQSRFYDSLDKNDDIHPDLPSREELCSFWSGIWEVPAQYNKDALWIKSAIPPTRAVMDTCKISGEDFLTAIKRVLNWKSPGIDCILAEVFYCSPS